MLLLWRFKNSKFFLYELVLLTVAWFLPKLLSLPLIILLSLLTIKRQRFFPSERYVFILRLIFFIFFIFAKILEQYTGNISLFTGLGLLILLFLYENFFVYKVNVSNLALLELELAIFVLYGIFHFLLVEAAIESFTIPAQLLKIIILLPLLSLILLFFHSVLKEKKSSLLVLPLVLLWFTQLVWLWYYAFYYFYIFALFIYFLEYRLGAIDLKYSFGTSRTDRVYFYYRVLFLIVGVFFLGSLIFHF